MPIVKNPVLKKVRKSAQDKRYEAVRRKYEAGVSVPEIAEWLGIHRGTVYTILSKGKAK